MKTNLRLIVALVTSLLDEALIIALILWVLPMVGIRLSLALVAVIVVGFAIFAVVTFKLGTRALAKKPMIGLTSMINCTGKVTSPLDPEGYVKIKGELWHAVAEGEYIDSGQDIIVVGQERLKLIVRRINSRETGK